MLPWWYEGSNSTVQPHSDWHWTTRLYDTKTLVSTLAAVQVVWCEESAGPLWSPSNNPHPGFMRWNAWNVFSDTFLLFFTTKTENWPVSLVWFHESDELKRGQKPHVVFPCDISPFEFWVLRVRQPVLVKVPKFPTYLKMTLKCVKVKKKLSLKKKNILEPLPLTESAASGHALTPPISQEWGVGSWLWVHIEVGGTLCYRRASSQNVVSLKGSSSELDSFQSTAK